MTVPELDQWLQALRLICASHELVDAGLGFRFTVTRYGREIRRPLQSVQWQGIMAI
jgi:hypothetical protein